MALTLKVAYFFVERMARERAVGTAAPLHASPPVDTAECSRVLSLFAQAEPFSSVLERSAARSPTFRAACTRLATWQSRLEYNRSLRRLAHDQSLAELHPDPGRAHWVPSDDLTPPPELSEREATQRGAEMLGEAFVVSVGLALLYHQAASDRADEAERASTIEENERRVGEMEAQLTRVSDRLAAMEADARARDQAALEGSLEGTGRGWWASSSFASWRHRFWSSRPG